MKKNRLLIALSLVFTFFIGVTSCDNTNNPQVTTSATNQVIDYVENFKYDETSSRPTEVVTVHAHIDGDTTHFNSSNPLCGPTNILKARYLGVDTPESTGKVQPWGKKASNFTKSKLESASHIMVESGSDQWELDSTGERFLVFVWYRTSEASDWRLLNLEILQNGFAAAKSISSTCYGEVLNKALAQAQAQKLHYYSPDKDPDFPYGQASVITLRELRTNIEEYNGLKIRFEGLVTKEAGNTVYVEDYDEETSRSYGIAVYLGFDTYPMIAPGNIVSFCGHVSLYETAGTYQVSGLTYMATKPDYRDNVKLVSENNEIIPTPITVPELDENGDILQSTNVSMSNLTVNRTYTTNNGGDNDGALTLTCTDTNGNEVTIRTSVLYHDDGSTLVTSNDLLNKTISIKSGIVDMYNDEYQVHVFSYGDLTISN